MTPTSGLTSCVHGPQPRLAGDLAGRFVSKAQYLASSVERVDAPAQVPTAVARYLAEQGLPTQAVVTGDVAGGVDAGHGGEDPGAIGASPLPKPSAIQRAGWRHMKPAVARRGPGALTGMPSALRAAG